MNTSIASNWRALLHALLIAVALLWAMPRNARAQQVNPPPKPVRVGTPPSKPYQPQAPDNQLRHLLNQIDQNQLKATVQMLANFGTRHTSSSQTDPARGIGAATAWVFQQLQTYAAASSGHMTVQEQTFVQPVSPNIPVPTTITNVIATLTGSVSPNRTYVILAHIDDRVTDILDFTSDSPGADADASGVAVVMELARVMANVQPNATIVFSLVGGEEQGLYGSTFEGAQLNAASVDVEGMLNVDTVGSSTAQDGTPDPYQIRLSTEGVPTAATPAEISLAQSIGNENDSSSRELGRFAKSVAENGATDMFIWLINRRDRYHYGGDQIAFQRQGFPAARFTEPNENFNHERVNVQVVNGVQFGDLVSFLHFGFLARVARVNAATAWSLAQGPGTPKNVVLSLGEPSNENSTNLSWDLGTDPSLAGYEVVWRETDDPDWTHVIPVGNVMSVSFSFFAKDNFLIGVRAVDVNGHHSPVAYPTLGP
jgi:Peptidase family M28